MKNKYSILVTIISASLLIGTPIHGIAAQKFVSYDNTFDLSYFDVFENSFEFSDGSTMIGYQTSQSSIGPKQQYLANDQLLIALNYLLAAENNPNPAQKEYLVDHALMIMKFVTSNLNDPYSLEKNGTVMFYDDNLGDNTYSRAPRLARDQALFLWALDKSLNFIDPITPLYNIYTDLINDVWIFLNNQFHDMVNQGWFNKITPISQTNVTLDTSKNVADNMLIALSLLSINSSRLGLSSATIGDQVKLMLDFFREKFRPENLGVIAVGSANGTVTSNNVFFAKDSVLYGLANLAYYEKFSTTNDIYLTEAKQIWEFVVENMWDEGFWGIFGASDNEGLAIIAGKALEDQVLFGLLSARLMPFEITQQDRFTDFYLQVDAIIKLRYQSESGNLFWTSADRRLNPSNDLFARPAAYAGLYLQETPHIIGVEISESAVIGSKVPIVIYIKTLSNIPLNVTIKSESGFNQVSVIANESMTVLEIQSDSNTFPGQRSLSISLSLKKTEFQIFEFTINLQTNVRVPSELIYLVGAGILAGAILLVRRPPEWLQKRISEFNLTALNEKSTDESQGSSKKPEQE